MPITMQDYTVEQLKVMAIGNDRRSKLAKEELERRGSTKKVEKTVDTNPQKEEDTTSEAKPKPTKRRTRKAKPKTE